MLSEEQVLVETDLQMRGDSPHVVTTWEQVNSPVDRVRGKGRREGSLGFTQHAVDWVCTRLYGQSSSQQCLERLYSARDPTGESQSHIQSRHLTSVFMGLPLRLTKHIYGHI